ncbi:uncharacterized protein CANTADRAFT_48991 [Suhomyces tanzawaensis NRRL Y-17324]|uniref:PCI domain-containing protein n=1 Tax=Suhomyces tanzawaensis NRRL Y-17324 TaxID=984487 RepID=A0A1E4SJW6_9ASCO|nr:uncharacterized protein CANTADRAFT_48991 [Suhomyces tanzawaensis NRRL Y-17324]ODV79805.1 hypothetical protein CANTADRAFT_48991 [Suhomyces tanzawaensis NRRL Y-17324]
MASVIVVENDLKDSAREYAQIIDAANQNKEFSESLGKFFKDGSDEISNKSELIDELYKGSSTGVLSKLTDKEFEPTFNLLVYLVGEIAGKQAWDDSKSPLFQILLDTNPKQKLSLRDRKSIKTSTILSAFNTIFNLLPQTSRTRLTILHQILNVVETSNFDYSIIEKNFGSNLVQCATAAQATDAEVKELFWKFVNLDTKYTEKSLHSIKKFTQSHSLNVEELKSLIKFALSSETVDISFLVNNNVASALAANTNEPLVSIFKQYITGEVVEQSKIQDGLPAEFIHNKSRILSLARFFSQASQSKIVFQYSEIPNGDSAYELESLLVTAIKTGVFEGKLNQLAQTFTLSRVNKLIVAGNDQQNAESWKDAKQALIDWKTSLTNIKDIVKSSRENIVNAGSN